MDVVNASPKPSPLKQAFVRAEAIAAYSPESPVGRSAVAKSAALGGGGAAIRLGSEQECELSDAGLDDAGAGRGAGDDRAAPVPAGEPDERSCLHEEGARAGRPPGIPHEAGDRDRGDRPYQGHRRTVRLRTGRCRLWPERAIPPGAQCTRSALDGWHFMQTEGLSRRCGADLSGRGPGQAVQAAHSGQQAGCGGDNARECIVAHAQLAPLLSRQMAAETEPQSQEKSEEIQDAAGQD